MAEEPRLPSYEEALANSGSPAIISTPENWPASRDGAISLPSVLIVEPQGSAVLYQGNSSETPLPTAMTNTVQTTTGPTQVYVSQTLVVLGENPCSLKCQYCQKNVLTKVRRAEQRTTHINNPVIRSCGFLIWLFCPFLLTKKRMAEHYCTNCNSLIGVHIY